MLIGRRSRSRGIEPAIDLTGPPEDAGASHMHALLVATPEGTWTVVDLDSSNGTYVNDDPDPIPANQPVPLADGDRIHVGAFPTLAVAGRPSARSARIGRRGEHVSTSPTADRGVGAGFRTRARPAYRRRSTRPGPGLGTPARRLCPPTVRVGRGCPRSMAGRTDRPACKNTSTVGPAGRAWPRPTQASPARSGASRVVERWPGCVRPVAAPQRTAGVNGSRTGSTLRQRHRLGHSAGHRRLLGRGLTLAPRRSEDAGPGARRVLPTQRRAPVGGRSGVGEALGAARRG
jgi:hypothetical protein